MPKPFRIVEVLNTHTWRTEYRCMSFRRSDVSELKALLIERKLKPGEDRAYVLDYGNGVTWTGESIRASHRASFYEGWNHVSVRVRKAAKLDAIRYAVEQIGPEYAVWLASHHVVLPTARRKRGFQRFIRQVACAGEALRFLFEVAMFSLNDEMTKRESGLYWWLRDQANEEVSIRLRQAFGEDDALADAAILGLDEPVIWRALLAETNREAAQMVAQYLDEPNMLVAVSLLPED